MTDPARTMIETPDSSTQVAIAKPVLRLFDRLNQGGLLWCSWKSNEHLEAGLTGKTDLDLLLDPNRKADIMAVLKDCGFTLFRTPPHRSYPDIVDAFAIDPETGILQHAHCHFSLVIGEKHLKSFTLPWANTMLLHRREQLRVQGVPVYAADSMDEMIILLIREALKFRWRDVVRFHMGKLWSDPGMKIEFDWLKQRIDFDEFRARAIGLASSPCSSQMTNILYKGLTLPGLLRLREIVQMLAAEKKWRRMSAPAAMIQAMWRELLFTFTQLQARYKLEWPVIPQKRILSDQGLVVLVQEGKQTAEVAKAIYESWHKKIDIRLVPLSREISPARKRLKARYISSLKRHGIISICTGPIEMIYKPDICLTLQNGPSLEKTVMDCKMTICKTIMS